jgi:hypothetical protein
MLSAPRLTVALDFAATARTLGATQRIHGLTLTANDLDWATGGTPEPVGEGHQCDVDQQGLQPVEAARRARLGV